MSLRDFHRIETLSFRHVCVQRVHDSMNFISDGAQKRKQRGTTHIQAIGGLVGRLFLSNRETQLRKYSKFSASQWMRKPTMEGWRTLVQEAHVVCWYFILCLLSQYFRSRTQKSLYFQIYWTGGQCLQWEPSGLIKRLNELLEMKEEVWSDYSVSKDQEGTDRPRPNLHITSPQRYREKREKRRRKWWGI